MTSLVRTQILLDKNQREELNQIAEKEGKSLSELIREYLQIQLRKEKYKAMRAAAEQLKADYEAGSDLTNLTLLDSEDFIDA